MRSFLSQDIPISLFTVNEVKAVINHLNPKKAPAYDLITNKVLKMLPETAIKYIIHICNAILKRGFFPSQWKIAQIIMIQKSSKPAELAESYRPISLLPVLSKLFEKLLLSRINIIMENHGLIPDHQFGFQSKHAATEQIHRIVKRINNDMEAGRYSSAVFLDVSQGFRQGYRGLLYKIKKRFPPDLYIIIRFYLHRTFRIKYGKEIIQLKEINFGVSQGNVLEPVLYLLCRSFSRFGFHNSNLYRQHSYTSSSQQSHKSIIAITGKSPLHSYMV